MLEIESFVNCVRTRTAPRVTGNAARAALAVAFQINAAIAAHVAKTASPTVDHCLLFLLLLFLLLRVKRAIRRARSTYIFCTGTLSGIFNTNCSSPIFWFNVSC